MIPRQLLPLLLVAAAGAAQADTLLIDGLDMAAPTSASRPARGIDMARVEAQFGAPSQRHGAVGEPPITRWDYPGFVVYFEHDIVLHSVARR